jgi:hypothetical protein
MSKPTMSLIYPILMPLAPWIAFIFNTMTTSKEAMIYCICKAMNHIITCHCITPIPILQAAIIKMVHCIAKKDGMPKGLKITNCTGPVLYDSTWIAGVDYDENEF